MNLRKTLLPNFWLPTWLINFSDLSWCIAFFDGYFMCGTWTWNLVSIYAGGAKGGGSAGGGSLGGSGYGSGSCSRYGYGGAGHP